jgi:hypothetical protein
VKMQVETWRTRGYSWRMPDESQSEKGEDGSQDVRMRTVGSVDRL